MLRAGAGILGLGALAAALHLVGCGASSSAEPPPLRVEYSGCESVFRGPVCALPEDRRLRLWVETAPDARLEIDGRPPPEGVEVAGGRRYEVEVPEGARELVVEARRGRRTTAWTLELGPSRQPEWMSRARELYLSGRPALARELIAGRLDALPSDERGAPLGLLARISIRQDEPERAEVELRQAIELRCRRGEPSDCTRDRSVLAHWLIDRRDFVGARQALADLPLPPGHADSTFLDRYYRGLLATETGDVRNGLMHLDAAAETAERLGLEGFRRMARQVLSRERQRVGHLEGEEELATLLAEAREASDCDRFALLNNYAWALLLALEAGLPADDPVPYLEEASALLEDCPLYADERPNLSINLALAQLHQGRPADARRMLAVGDDPAIGLLLWRADVEARLALADGDAALALELYAALERRARQAASPEAGWRAAVGQARAHARLGDGEAAVAAFARAEEILDGELLKVPMHAGRRELLFQRQHATALHLDALLDLGRPDEVFDAVRRARGRSLRSLRRFVAVSTLDADGRRRWDDMTARYHLRRDALDRAAAEFWRLPSGEHERALASRRRELEELRGELDRFLAGLDGGETTLASPAAGEVCLAYHPLPRGWVGLAATADGVVARRLDGLEPLLARPEPPLVELAARLVAPFAAEIEEARRLRVLAHGRLRGVDFHALPFAGDVLIARLPTAYGLDLPPPPPAAGDLALVVSDPEENLPFADREARTVGAQLGDAWSLEHLRGRAVGGGELRRRLPDARLFHYAGHAFFDGWNSSLRLAGNGRLRIDDVLALGRGPELVVLSGCETGRDADGAAETIGLAHAFAAAGARAVVAAVRPLDDEDAATLMDLFYRRLGRGQAPVEALAGAQLALRRARPNADWAAFRAYVP